MQTNRIFFTRRDPEAGPHVAETATSMIPPSLVTFY